MLKEIIALLGAEGIAKEKIDNLPNIVDILKRYIREELPLIDIRVQPIALNLDKLLLSRLFVAEVIGIDNQNPI